MKITIVTTQAELDQLPTSFDEYTRIEIRSAARIVVASKRGNSSVVARGNSSVVARGNSSVEAWENSSVEAWENSSVEAWENSFVVAWENSSVEAWENSSVVARENSSVVARGNSSVVARENSSVVAWENSSVVACENSSVDCFLCATVFVYSIFAVIKSLRDNARLVYKKTNCKRPEIADTTATITEFEQLVIPTFEQWLERGYVVADGIVQKLESQKTIGEVTVFEVSETFGGEKSFVAKIGNKFAHGKTLEEAKADLRYKLSDRDTSKFKSWNLEVKKPLDQMIEAYMAITGACSFGTKQFCESISLQEEYSPKEIIHLTAGKYGNRRFMEFFGVQA
jgi:hypothetical protein